MRRGHQVNGLVFLAKVSQVPVSLQVCDGGDDLSFEVILFDFLIGQASSKLLMFLKLSKHQLLSASQKLDRIYLEEVSFTCELDDWKDEVC